MQKQRKLLRQRSFLPSATVYEFAVTLHRRLSLQPIRKALLTYAKKLLIVGLKKLALLFILRRKLLNKLGQLSLPPLVSWCVFFCLGIIAEKAFKIPFVFLCGFVIFCLLFCLLFLKKRLICCVFLYCVVFFIGASVFANSGILPYNSIERIAPYKKLRVCLKGMVASVPNILEGKASFIFKPVELKEQDAVFKVRGKVLVRCSYDPGCVYGEELFITGNLFKTPAFLKNSTAAAILYVRDMEDIVKIGRNKGFIFVNFFVFLKHKIQKIIFSNLDSISAAIVDAMVLGDKEKVPELVKEAMIKIGTWHIMVVSGSNTGLVAFILLVFLKIFRINKKLRYCFVVGFLVFYCFLTGASSPVVRATVMAIALLISYIIERNPIFYNSLALAALIILFFDPAQLFNVGFQLSFVSVFFIVWLFQKINVLLMPKASNSIIYFIVGCFSVSFSAWLGTAPIIAYVFGNFSVITVLANMVVVPLAMLVVSTGFALVAVGWIFPQAVHLIGYSCDFLIFLLLKSNQLFVNLPFAYFTVPKFSFFIVVGYYVLLFLAAHFFFKKVNEGKLNNIDK